MMSGTVGDAYRGAAVVPPLTVLIVDDDFHVASLHRSIVSAVPGFRALPPVGSAQAASAAVATGAPDLVLLDVYLPDRNGLELLKELDVDAVVISAACDGASIRMALRNGAIGFLIKPFSAEQLVDRLNAYARFRNVLSEQSVPGQEAIERALKIVHAGDRLGSNAPRSVTELSVVAALEDSNLELSAQQVAELVGVSRATAQRYLARLAARGAVTVQLRYGSTGRPEHRYSAVGGRPG
jgi:two-component system CitB family response regulator